MSRTTTRVLAGAGALALALLVPVSTAAAQSETPVITNTETVNATLTPSGEVSTVLIYDQTSVQGSGDVSFTNPVSTEGLRNLDTFGAFSVQDGAIVESTSVDGLFRQRSVSDFTKDLPVTVDVTYTLDGEDTEPADLVGKSGRLDVEYTITNVTCKQQSLNVAGAEGAETTQAEICDPLAGTLSFTLPSTYTDITSDTGFVAAGDGRGGTLMNLSITLITGLTGSETVAGYSAQVEDATIPPASMSIVPVVVTANPSANAQLEALQGGAESGQELASGATQIDENVLKLADGASDLVAGLLQLRDGSAQLSDGLVNTAAPGAEKLAAGSSDLADGLNNTAVPGSALLADGAGTLASGLNGTAVPGSAALADGATQLSDGINSLDAEVPTLVDGVTQLYLGSLQLEAGLQQLQSQVPALTDGVSQLSDGADQLEAGLLALQAQIPTLVDGVNQLAAGGQRLSAGLNGLGAGLDARFGPGLNQLATDLTTAAGAGGLADQVIGGINTIKGTCAANGLPNPVCEATATAVSNNVDTTVRDDVQAAADGANALNNGYLAPLDPNNPANSGIRATIGALSVGADDLSEGLLTLQGQLPTLTAGVDALVAGATKLAAGLAQLEANVGPLGAGVDALTAGATTLAEGLADLNAATGPLADGVAQLAAGGVQVADGADQLASGLVTAGTGSAQLASGADQLAAGLVTAGDGASQVAAGNEQLADGLGTAADGSQQLAEGLQTAAEGAPALPAGALRLSNEGTSQLVKAGQETAMSFGTRVAVLEASAELTADGALPYGAPEGALKAAAYRYDLKGASGANVENVAQLVAGVGIAGAAAAGAAVLARRRATGA